MNRVLTGGLAVLAGVAMLLLAAGPARAAAVDDAALRQDLVNYEGVDRSNEPLAGWDEIDLGDNARELMRVPDRTLFRLAPGRDGGDTAPQTLSRYRYDDPSLNTKRDWWPKEFNTLRNFLMLMFLTQE